MAKLKKLRTILGNVIYPYTVTKAVYDKKYGNMENIVESINNPNILLNGRFNVCQRNSVKSFNYTSANNGDYLFDRWRFYGDNDSVISNTDGLGLKYELATDSTIKSCNKMEQMIDDTTRTALSGKYITMSAKVRTIGHHTFKMGITYLDSTNKEITRTLVSDKTLIENEWYEVSITAKLPEATEFSSLRVFAYLVDTTSDTIGVGATTEIKYVKLEEGKAATYSALNTSYLEELEKCKRYFQIVNISNARITSISTNALTLTYGPVSKMRCTGVCTVKNGTVKTFNTVPTVVSDVSLSATHNNDSVYGEITITGTKSSHGLTDATMSGVTVEIDCEL